MARLTVALALALAGAACGGGVAPSRAAKESAGARAPRELQSNILFEDYAGSAACARCHEAEHASWSRSAMHNMTRDAASAKSEAPWGGATFRFKGDTATLASAGGKRFITIASARFGGGTYLVTRVIGGHHREDYAGVLVASAADPRPLASPAEELVLPVSFVYATRSLRYKGYSVMVKERAGLRAGPVWSKTCIFCHNTPPHLDTILGGLAGREGRPYQGEVVDALLPPGKRVSWLVKDERALAAALGRELARLGAPAVGGPSPALAIEGVRSHFKGEHLVEIGIGCESCHLGAAEHVRDPRVSPSFEPRARFLSVSYPLARGAGAAEERAARVNRVCAKCHQVLFSGYEPTWEGGARRTNPGGSQINSGEARDMLLGACASRLTCVECHDPHAPDATASLRRLSRADENALCTRCHQDYATPEAARAHTHHDPAREGGACLSCHMPRKNMALDGGLTRYHRIGSPTSTERVHLDRPLECALCHADQTVESLVGTMEKWWGRRYDRGALEKLYGALDANVILATAEHGKPHEQAVAFQVLGETRTRAGIPALGKGLVHAYPIVRGYAKRALDAIEGRPVDIDIDAEDEAIQAKARSLRP